MEVSLEDMGKDEGLRSKRKVLVVTSLFLLVLSLSGAKIEEANSLIFKVSFENQNGISQLFVFSVFFLLIRYNSCVHIYLKKLYETWASNLLNRSFFQVYAQDINEPIGTWYGALVELVKDRINLNEVEFEKPLEWSATYICGMPFCRYIRYHTVDHFGNESVVKVNIYRKSHKIYILTLIKEFNCQLSDILTKREYLDIYSPYILATISLLTYFYTDKVLYLINGMWL